MAPPPPSQQGKFKPKRQPKKINRPGAALQDGGGSGSAAAGGGGGNNSGGLTVAFDMTGQTSAATAAATSGAASSSRSSFRGGRGGRGQGNSGGRGRGRGRTPIPQGRAFFTGSGGADTKGSSGATGAARASTGVTASDAGTKTKASAKRSSTAAAGSSASVPIDMSTEEVVGELDIGIGGNAADVVTSTDATENQKRASSSRTRKSTADSRDVEMVAPIFHPYTYDSDSSDDNGGVGVAGLEEDDAANNLQPVQLPFGAEPASPTNVTSSQQTSQEMSNDGLPTMASPFAEMFGEKNGADSADDSWFLVQLPSRLPPLRQKELDSQEAVPDAIPSSGGPATSANANGTSNIHPMRQLSDVVTHPVLADKFDNELASAAPGKIGRILVYKSGKTVLEMESAGGEKVRRVNSIWMLDGCLRPDILGTTTYYLHSHLPYTTHRFIWK